MTDENQSVNINKLFIPFSSVDIYVYLFCLFFMASCIMIMNIIFCMWTVAYKEKPYRTLECKCIHIASQRNNFKHTVVYVKPEILWKIIIYGVKVCLNGSDKF